MNVLVAGATGAIGRPLISALVSARHNVFGMTSSKLGPQTLKEDGAEGLLASALDAQAVDAAIKRARPEVVIDELTSLPKHYTPDEMRAAAERDHKLRVEGGQNVLNAARAAGARRYIIQSTGFYYAPGPGLAHETDPLALNASPAISANVRTYTQLAHSARRVWKELLFVMDSFTGPAHGSGQTGTQLIRCWNSGIQLRARDREFGLGCTLRTRRRPPSPRLNALQVSTTLLTTTRRSCPSGCPHLPLMWERWNRSTSASAKPSSKQGPTLSTMRLNCGALQTQRRDEILPLRQDGSNGSPEQKPQAGHHPGGLGLTEKAKTNQAA
jgi:hypothetical protein